MENVRVFPSASVSEGSSKLMSRNWPAWNIQFDGFSKRNAVVRSATSCRLTSLDRVTGEAVVVVMRSPSSSAPSESAFYATDLRGTRYLAPGHLPPHIRRLTVSRFFRGE